MVTKADTLRFYYRTAIFLKIPRMLYMRHFRGPAEALRGPSAATPTDGDAGDGRGERPGRPPAAGLAGAPHSSQRRPPGGHLASCRSGALLQAASRARASCGSRRARAPRLLPPPSRAGGRARAPALPKQRVSLCGRRRGRPQEAARIRRPAGCGAAAARPRARGRGCPPTRAAVAGSVGSAACAGEREGGQARTRRRCACTRASTHTPCLV